MKKAEETLKARFEWDSGKSRLNKKKHGVRFITAQRAFLDPNRIIAKDLKHSKKEPRYFCIGRVGDCVITVRFTYRGNINKNYWGRLLEKGEVGL